MVSNSPIPFQISPARFQPQDWDPKHHRKTELKGPQIFLLGGQGRCHTGSFLVETLALGKKKNEERVNWFSLTWILLSKNSDEAVFTMQRQQKAMQSKYKSWCLVYFSSPQAPRIRSAKFQLLEKKPTFNCQYVHLPFNFKRFHLHYCF